MAGRRLIPAVLLIGLLSICALPPVGARAFSFQAPSHSLLQGERSGPDRFVLGGIAEECKDGYFSGTFYSRTLELVPVYDNCIAKALGGLQSTFILYGCAYLVRAEGRAERRGRWTADVDLTCPTDYSLRWQIYEEENGPEPVCTTLMPPQTGIGTAEVSNMGGHPSDITIHWDLDELEYEAFGSTLLCGIPKGVKAQGASYTGYSTIRATDLAEHPKSLAVGG